MIIVRPGIKHSSNNVRGMDLTQICKLDIPLGDNIYGGSWCWTNDADALLSGEPLRARHVKLIEFFFRPFAR